MHHERYVLLSLETHQEECHLYMYVYISVFRDWKISSQLIGPDTMCNIRRVELVKLTSRVSKLNYESIHKYAQTGQVCMSVFLEIIALLWKQLLPKCGNMIKN